MSEAELQPPQNMVALARANEIRIARAALKRQIASGEATVAEFITQPLDPQFEGMAINELLCAQHRWGVDRAANMLQRLHIGETRRLGLLTERQRWLIADELTMPYSERKKRWTAEAAERWVNEA